MIDPKILNKIKKCLALSTSPNANEAATALRQAHALMRAHGVDAHHVARSSVGQATIKSKTMARDKPAHWEGRLAHLVGKAFGCKMMVARNVLPKAMKKHLNEGEFVFIGQTSQCEIAAYTATVLIRKCKSARQKWIHDHLRNLPPPVGKGKATRMGDAFAEGWVLSIENLVKDFANPPEIDQAIDQVIAENTIPDDTKTAMTRTLKNSKIGASELVAAKMGMLAAKGESLYRPMAANNTPLALERP